MWNTVLGSLTIVLKLWMKAMREKMNRIAAWMEEGGPMRPAKGRTDDLLLKCHVAWGLGGKMIYILTCHWRETKRNRTTNNLLRASQAYSTIHFFFQKRKKEVSISGKAEEKIQPCPLRWVKPAMGRGGGRWCCRISFLERYIENVVQNVCAKNLYLPNASRHWHTSFNLLHTLCI